MKKRNKIEEMTAQHQFVWNTLTMLEDGERILGADLRQRSGVSDARTLFSIINELRLNGYLVGGDKSGERGYYEIRTANDMARTLHSLRKPALDLLNTASIMEKHFEERFGTEEGDDHDKQ